MVVIAVVPFGVTLVGLKVQVASDGSPEGQLKVTAWLKPACGVTVIVDVPLCPGELMVIVVGFAAMVKSSTAKGRIAEVDAPKAKSPPYAAVTELLPPGRLVIVNVATPALFNGAVPNDFRPVVELVAKNCTVCGGLVTAGAGLTVALKDVLAPKITGDAVGEVSEVVVGNPELLHPVTKL